MKCKLMEKNVLTIMLIAGLLMMAGGAACGFLFDEEAHTATKIAGMVSGMGSAFAVLGGALLLRRRRLGEEKARDSELAMGDERGLAVAYRAQNVAAIAAILCIIVIMIVALIRGDSVYMMMGVAACLLVAAAKMVAWYIYNRTM